MALFDEHPDLNEYKHDVDLALKRRVDWRQARPGLEL